ncbi:aminotransferase class I/II-fold pyridoxal phosphate-dependent enzyme [Candidatus Acetothermia bacterium]|nr:aminotransferase class I/II-fold pyridoxal phosphate-dependent enzyme [Candidatus Acetothermia bacterium]
MNFTLAHRLNGIEKSLIRQVSDLAGPNAIPLGLGEPSFPTPQPLLEAARKFLEKGHVPYTPNAGLRELRELIAKATGRGIDHNWVCVTVGGQEAIFIAMLALVNLGDDVLIPNPGYPAYRTVAKLLGANIVDLPLRAQNGFSVSAEDVERAVTLKTKLIFLNSPQNPTGAVDSASELQRIAQLIAKRDIWVISDEVYSRIYYGEAPISIARFAEKAIVVDSLSKTFSMTGWRLGWVIAPPELMQHLVALNQNAITCAPTVSQRVAMVALQGAADTAVGEMRDEYRRRREIMMESVKKFVGRPYTEPRGAFYLWLDVSHAVQEYGSTLELAKELVKQKQTVVSPGIGFGSRGEGYLRLSFAAEPEQIREGVKRLGEFLNETV